MTTSIRFVAERAEEDREGGYTGLISTSLLLPWGLQRWFGSMAKLPNGENALIPMEKLVDYCLNPDHPRGKDKARVFASVLGITRDSANQLTGLIQQAAVNGDVTKEETTMFGRYYRVDWAIPSMVDVVLRTIWEIAPDEEIPRLVSAFIR